MASGSGAARSGFEIGEIRKRLVFPSTPVVDGNDRFAEPNNAMTLMNRLQIDHDIEIVYKSCQKDMHEQRLKHLRQKLKSIADDDWRYPSVDKLIGLQ
ncbi:hypothetical protein ScPMuIL_004804 [Solemya velum]